MSAPHPEGQALPDDTQRLRDEIERTREHLGATVEQLAAKVDVKSRARARAVELTGQAKERVTRLTREQPVPLAAAAAGALAVVVSLVIWQRRRR
jgi:Protein of unknown function (DUF3618)